MEITFIRANLLNFCLFLYNDGLFILFELFSNHTKQIFVVSNSINCVSTNSTDSYARKIEVETRAHESGAKRYCLKKANHLACRSLGSIPT